MTPTVQLLHGDCIVEMEALASAGFAADSIVCDPPYGWSFMGRDWDSPDNVAFRPDTWRLALQLLPPGGMLAAFGGAKSHHRLMVAVEDAGFEIFDVAMWLHGQGFPKAKTQLKPAYEPIILARKPTKGPVRALNIDDCRVEIAPADSIHAKNPHTENRGAEGGWCTRDGVGAAYSVPSGRWPANILHSGEPEVMDLFAEFGESKSSGHTRHNTPAGVNKAHSVGRSKSDWQTVGPRDSGSAARFYYCAKASKAERAGSKHPCIKPQALLRWLIRLITPPGGMVLDCFAGAGSTGMACLSEGRSAVLIEREAEHIDDARRRLGWLERA